MDTENKKDAAEALDVRDGSASFRILKEALADGAFDGAGVAPFGDYSVSWNTTDNTVAIADSGGWWVMPTETLKAIAAATPNDQDQQRRAPGNQP